MKPVSPVIVGLESREVDPAHNQPQYGSLPSLFIQDEFNTCLTRWELTADEVEVVIRTGSIFVWQATFGGPVAPLKLTTEAFTPDQVSPVDPSSPGPLPEGPPEVTTCQFGPKVGAPHLQVDTDVPGVQRCDNCFIIIREVK